MTRIPTRACVLGVMALAYCAVSAIAAPQAGLERLSRDVLDVVPPSARVRGGPGEMAVQPQPCRAMPTAQSRRRIVDVAVQEWAFFGFRLVDETEDAETEAPENGVAADRGASTDPQGGRRRRPRLPAAEASRVAGSVAGYWAVTPEGAWIVERQNEEWAGPDGIAARWNAPWSAAFVSWVMCEAGLGAAAQFQRAIAHHAYIDQAIRARDGRAPQAAFVAYDPGERDIDPGDLLCSSRRPAYRSVGERRRQMGVGARSHCDVVVKVDGAGARILAIGGNVRGTVSLKAIAADSVQGKVVPRRRGAAHERPIFAHLKLRAAPIEAHALDTSATFSAVGCRLDSRTSALLAAASVAPSGIGDRC